jgi:hypothetical protein
MVIKIHTPLSDATPADVGAGLNNEMTVNPADLLAALLATGPGTPNALQQAIQALVPPPSTSPSFATPAQTIAGMATDLIVNPADLYARENIAAQTGLGLVLSAIPAPTASQSSWGVNTLGETLHYAPGLGWKIVADYLEVDGKWPDQPAVTNPGATQGTYIAPRSGTIHATQWCFSTSAGNLNSSVRVYILVNGIAKTENLSSSTVNGQGMSVSCASTFKVVAGDVITFGAGWGFTKTGISQLKYSIVYTA